MILTIVFLLENKIKMDLVRFETIYPRTENSIHNRSTHQINQVVWLTLIITDRVRFNLFMRALKQDDTPVWKSN